MQKGKENKHHSGLAKQGSGGSGSGSEVPAKRKVRAFAAKRAQAQLLRKSLGLFMLLVQVLAYYDDSAGRRTKGKAVKVLSVCMPGR